MGLSPSEKKKLISDVKGLVAANDELDKKQSADIDELKKEIRVISRRLLKLEKELTG